MPENFERAAGWRPAQPPSSAKKCSFVSADGGTHLPLASDRHDRSSEAAAESQARQRPSGDGSTAASLEKGLAVFSCTPSSLARAREGGGAPANHDEAPRLQSRRRPWKAGTAGTAGKSSGIRLTGKKPRNQRVTNHAHNSVRFGAFWRVLDKRDDFVHNHLNPLKNKGL